MGRSFNGFPIGGPPTFGNQSGQLGTIKNPEMFARASKWETSPAVPSFLLLEDGVSKFTLEDGSGSILLES